ncbi:MAG: hypothetical protein WCK90_05010 [archaeon]
MIPLEFLDTKTGEELKRFHHLLKQHCWSKETSADALWTPENHSLGQCAVTSVLVQDYFRGEIVWAKVKDPRSDTNVSHYFNVLNDLEVDLTREQFPEGSIIPLGVPKLNGFPSTREYVLSYPPTVARYEILKAKMREWL